MEPIRRSASLRTSSFDFTTLTPPALPRPPAWICALTTSTGASRSSAALTASSTEKAGSPRGTGTPNSRSTALAWYSWMFMRAPCCAPRAPSRRVDDLAPAWVSRRPSRPPCAASLILMWRDLLASLDQGCNGLGRLFEHGPFGAVQLDHDDWLDTRGADHSGQ